MAQQDILKIIEKLFSVLGNKSFSFAESCTGGYVSSLITAIPGASAFFKGSVVSYSNEAKISLLKIPANIIKKNGAVSEITAAYMAKGARDIFKTDYSVSVTGYAGPLGSDDSYPVGTVFVSICYKNKIITQKLILSGNRIEIREKAATKMILSLLDVILELNPSGFSITKLI